MSNVKLPIFTENNDKKYHLKKLLTLDEFNPVIFTEFSNFIDFIKNTKHKIVIMDIFNDENIYTYLENLENNSKNTLSIILSPLPKSHYGNIENYKIEFFKKPIDYNEFQLILESSLEKENKIKKFSYKKLTSDFITNSNKMIGIYDKLKKIAKTDATVLISGETGTGKEIIANTIQNFSNRNNKEFVKINCAALPDNLLESELFGYEKGAFTGASQRKIGKFEYADNGTIFLDEIGEMPLKLQAKILRVLQEHQLERLGSNKSINIDIRVLTATNKDLKKLVEENKFREDLFYRLNVLTIDIPPLRKRRDDIKALSQYYLEVFNKKYNNEIKGFSNEVINAFINYSWPGNVRELKNLIESISILTDKKIITKTELPDSFLNLIHLPEIPDKNSNSKKPISNNLEQTEKKTIIETLKSNDWNKTKTAKELGISRKTLYNKLNKYDIKY